MFGAIAGCYVRDGVITRGSKVRFLRDGVVIWKGAITSLRRFKDDVREVQSGFECGIGLSDFQDLKEGDIIETFEERENFAVPEPQGLLGLSARQLPGAGGVIVGSVRVMSVVVATVEEEGVARGRRSHDKPSSPYPRTARVNQVLREVVADAASSGSPTSTTGSAWSPSPPSTRRPTCPGPPSI